MSGAGDGTGAPGPAGGPSCGSDDGVIAYFHAQLLALPRVSQALGESDGYARVDAVAVPPVADDATSRRIFLLVRDRGQERWIAMNAYDTADVCVQGRRQP